MTSIASTSPAPPAATSNSTNASTPSTKAHAQSPSVSGQTTPSAAVPASAPASRQASLSYANVVNSKKTPTGPGASSGIAASQVSGGVSGQHARSVSATSVPVNGKIQPAVPQIGNSGNSVANGTTPYSGGQHSRKTSLASGAMPNGASRGAPNIKFGNINEPGSGPQPSGTAVAAGNNLTAPVAPNPRASSPSPSNAVQPVASGGAPPSAGTARPIQFGDTTPHQRPLSLPPQPHPPQGPNSMGPQGHARRDSTQSAHGESGPTMSHGRGMPPAGRGGRHQTYGQNQFQPSQPYGYGRGYQGGGNQQRNGPANMGAPVPYTQQYPNSPHRVPRSPALSQASTHASPSLSTAVPSTPQLFPPAHGQGGYLPGSHYPVQQMYPDPYYGPHYQVGYPQYQQTSPRPGFSQMAPPMNPGFAPSYVPQPTPMSRSSSTNVPDVHNRPPSSVGQHPTPSMTPQPQNFVSPATPSTPGPPPSPYGRQKKVTKAIEIKNPTTGATVKIDQKPTSSPTVASASTSVIVSSPSPTPGRAPSRPEAPHSRSTSRNSKTPQEKRQEMRDKVLLEAKKAAAEEDKKRKEEAEKSELDKKRQEEEAEAEKKRKEDEERAKAEAEEKAKREAEEEAARQEAARQEAARQEAARQEAAQKEAAQKEAARQEAARKEAARKEVARQEAARKEAEETARKVAEEKELARKEAEEKAKLEAEEKALLEQEEKERREAAEKAKAEAEEAIKAAEAPAEADIEAPSTPADAPAPKPSSPDSESMPPPALKSIERSRSKPSPLNLQLKTNEPALPSAQLTALRSARPVENLKGLHYPEGIQSPNPALNPLATATRFKYDKDFLMQFQNVFTEKPYVDWDQRMRDTVGDTDSARPGTARTPSGTGSRSTSSRGSGMPPPLGGGAMGSFVGFGKSGSTSMERFQKSTANPLAGFVGSMSRPGGGLVRANSSTSLAGQSTTLPQSPRTSNRSARGSKRGGAGGASMERSESKQASSQPTIPLAEVKPLPVSANRWTPRSVATTKAVAEPGASEPDDRMPPDMVQRKVKAALNKMTPEKFDKISDQILEITSQSKHENDGRTLRQVIQLTFEKACDEAHWASMYAKFCKRMLETMDPNIKDEGIRDRHEQVVTGGNLFRKYLLNRCQEEFERGWKVNLPPKPEGESEEVAILSDEYYIAAAAKRRGLGLVQFIGELFKLGMLTERIMNECVRKLLDFEGLPEDETVESLTKLLRTIGAQLDSSEKSKPIMDLYFKRIDSMINSKDLNSRMRFMLMDIVDLRKNKWTTRETDKGPKTIQEVREEALKAQQEKEAASRANRGNRPQGGRGDPRTFSSGGYGMHPPAGYHESKSGGTVNADDLRKLGARTRNPTSGPTFGPSSMLGPRGSGSRRGLGPNPNRDDSGPSSRTATPPAPASTSSPNMFSLLEASSHNDGNETTSPPPSNANSPQVSNAKPITAEEEK